MRSRFLTIAALTASVALAGCESFDPLDKLSDLDIMGTSKKPLVGDRRSVFDSGVPGVPQGVPPELVRGYQPPPEAPPPVVEAKRERPKPKPKQVVRRAPPQEPQQRQAQPQPQQPMRQAPAAQSTQQQSAGPNTSAPWPAIPGSQPTWPTNAPPAPTR